MTLIYQATRDKKGQAQVAVNSRPLPIRWDLCHSAREFEWGYGGSGPAQLAMSILADYFERWKRQGNLKGQKTDRLAEQYQHEFLLQVIAKYDMTLGWQLTEEQIATWLETAGYRPTPLALQFSRIEGGHWESSRFTLRYDDQRGGWCVTDKTTDQEFPQRFGSYRDATEFVVAYVEPAL